MSRLTKLVWFRNDLRTGDHRALYQACMDSAGEGVLAVAVISPKQWQLQDEAKCRVQFWLASLSSLQQDLQRLNIPLKVVRAATNSEIPAILLDLARQHQVDTLYFNREYPEYEQRRDQQVEELLRKEGIACLSFDNELVLPPGSVLNQQGGAYKVFTPFSRAWRRKFMQLNPQPLPAPPAQSATDIVSDPVPQSIGYGNTMGAEWRQDLWPAGCEEAHRRLQTFVQEQSAQYKQLRDFPAEPGTSSLSPYLSAGVLSTGQCLAAMQAYSESPDWFENQWVTELIWREFYRHLLVLFPEMNRWQPFKPEVEEKLRWESKPDLFRAWCAGETGYAMVDAGMKQLLETGWMHNRLRMVTAAFLCKLLRQDWRLGARFFMQHLIDGDFASNLGGWQWSAAVGADAAPYFRIFNPMRQAERFDPQGEYVGRWLPELVGLDWRLQQDPLFAQGQGRPAPLIDYARERNVSIQQYNGEPV